MLTHISLLIIIIAVKNSRSCSHGIARYKLSNQSTQTIKWKYFIPADSPIQQFEAGDIVFFSGKYVVESAEQCVIVAYASIINSGNPGRKFNTNNFPICDPHRMFYVGINQKLMETEDFIHFSAECTEYNSVTGSNNIKIEMTILYPSQSVRFKYLGLLGANIKTGNKYIVSGLVKFSNKGRMMIEAMNIDYVKSAKFSYNISKSPSTIKTNTRSIIDIIADNVKSINSQSKKPKLDTSSKESDNITTSKSYETSKTSTTKKEEHGSSSEKKEQIHIDSEMSNNYQEKKIKQDKDECARYSERDEENSQNEEQKEAFQAKPKKRSTRLNKKKKEKKQ
ncbi:29586_t:CDS:1 [Gigaspora margarita]|uniref:29586_t:CDS:1 n=1 Tax=Gigaspora margarita TaxID=4874 RepID=A0ABN7UNS9_GIGMA|nr:29586_t:CDS:1 [Gigaspora margarita]